MLKNRFDQLSRRVNSVYRAKRKHEAELAFWKESLRHLEDWFLNGRPGRTGIKPPSETQKVNSSESWVVNAVATRHKMCPSYTERLQIERDYFRGKRVLEIGCGPLAPILQFGDCTRHAVDPLVNVYMNAGWPLFEYDAKFINTGGERMPYLDGYFDAVISVNALDHVDDFEQVAMEMERVLRSGGEARFEVEYHRPTVTEPIELNEARVLKAFPRCELKPVSTRRGSEIYDALVRKFDLVPFNFQHLDEQFCTWRAIKK